MWRLHLVQGTGRSRCARVMQVPVTILHEVRGKPNKASSAIGDGDSLSRCGDTMRGKFCRSVEASRTGRCCCFIISSFGEM